jgi:hypothetical protein
VKQRTPEARPREGRRRSIFAATHESGNVLVFGCRHDVAIRALSRPASKKRQGTKSRGVGHWPGSECYGDLMLAPISMIDVMPAGFDLRVCTDRRWAERNRHFGGCSERINAGSAH